MPRFQNESCDGYHIIDCPGRFGWYELSVKRDFTVNIQKLVSKYKQNLLEK